jgi:hypothetical protein
MEYINVYKTLPKKKKKTYPNYDKLLIDLPCRMLFIGPSGSGKNVSLWNFIRLVDHWDTIIVIAKQLDQPIYNELKERAQKAEKRRKRRIWAGSESLADLPDLNDFDPKENNLVVIDDFICSEPKELKRVEEYFIRGRHKNVTPCFLSQSYFDTPKKVRRNANIVVIKQLTNVGDMRRILKEYTVSAKPEKVIEMYEMSIDSSEDGDPTIHWFCLDNTNTNDNLKFRKNFDGIDASFWKPKK